MLSTGRVIESTDAGEIFRTATATPRRFRVTDSSGSYVTGTGAVDMATAFRVLDGVLKQKVAPSAAPHTNLAHVS